MRRENVAMGSRKAPLSRSPSKMALTPSAATLLLPGMKPWKVTVDWTEEEQERVYVTLHIMDEDPRPLRTFPSMARAVDWTIGFFHGRGFHYLVPDLDSNQRHNRPFITLHPVPGYVPPEPLEGP